MATQYAQAVFSCRSDTMKWLLLTSIYCLRCHPYYGRSIFGPVGTEGNLKVELQVTAKCTFEIHACFDCQMTLHFNQPSLYHTQVHRLSNENMEGTKQAVLMNQYISLQWVYLCTARVTFYFI